MDPSRSSNPTSARSKPVRNLGTQGPHFRDTEPRTFNYLHPIRGAVFLFLWGKDARCCRTRNRMDSRMGGMIQRSFGL